MYKKLLLGLTSVVVVSVVLFLMLAQVRSVRSGSQDPTPTPTYAIAPVDESLVPVMSTAIQPTVVDLAPHIPYEDKPSVVVQHADGSRTRYLVAPNQLDAFIKNLPEEDTFLGDIPPPSLMYGEPPTSEP